MLYFDLKTVASQTNFNRLVPFHIRKNMTNLNINIKQDKSTCQEINTNSSFNRQQSPTQNIFQPEQRVYLYGDTKYKGKLIRPLERTYPPKWSVQLDRGGYAAVNVKDISLIESQPSNVPNLDLDLPFSDASESDLAKLQQEIAALKWENARLQQENELVKKDLDCAKQVIRRAKDISPLMRISLKRVLRLAHEACMDVQRTQPAKQAKSSSDDDLGIRPAAVGY